MNILDEIEYQIWAENLFFDSIESLSISQWINNDTALNKSLQQIFAHKTEVCWYWFSHYIIEESLDEAPNFENMSKSELRSTSITILEQMKNYVQENSDKQLELSISWIKQPYKISAQELIFNGLNHNTYHRGQLAILIRRYGIKIEDSDYNLYMFQKLGLEFSN